MQKQFPVWILGAFIILIFCVNALAEATHLYYLIWWFDIPMHIFGGTWVALFGLTYYYRYRGAEHSPEFVLFTAIALALVVGIAWEIFEWGVYKSVAIANDGVFDTLKDLTDDFIGSLLGALIFLKGGYNKRI